MDVYNLIPHVFISWILWEDDITIIMQDTRVL